MSPQKSKKNYLTVDERINRIFIEYCLKNTIDPDEAIALAITQFVVGDHFTATESLEYDRLINTVLKRLTAPALPAIMH